MLGATLFCGIQSGLLACRLTYPHLPCITAGSRAAPKWVPLELCHLAAGQRKLKLNEKQTAAMIKLAAQKPQDRASKIVNYVQQQSGLPQNPTVAAFQMQLNTSLMQVGLSIPTPSANLDAAYQSNASHLSFSFRIQPRAALTCLISDAT